MSLNSTRGRFARNVPDRLVTSFGGSSIDLRGVLENLTAQFEINNLRVLVVVVNNYSAGSGDHKNEHQEQDSE
jgi:hypothetical protein